MNIGKKLLSLLTVFCLTLSLVPTVALAADATSVTVYGVQMVSSDGSTTYYKNGSNGNKGSLIRNSSDYNAKYEPNTHTLTLNNYNGGPVIANGNLTILLDSTNNITSVNNGINITGNLTIEGTGSLELTGARNTTIYASGDITIQGGAKVKAAGGQDGQAIHAVGGTLTITGSGTKVETTDGFKGAIMTRPTGGGTINLNDGAQLIAPRSNPEIDNIKGNLKINGIDATEAQKAQVSAGITAATTYTVSGKVTDASGKAIDGATVQLCTADTVATSAATVINTSDQGGYSFSGIPAGTYTITVSKTGYEAVTKNNITVNNSNVSVEAITLSLTNPPVTRTYTVTIMGTEHMSPSSDSGALTQTVNQGSEIKIVVLEAEEGYYFPTNYTEATVDGFTVKRDSAYDCTSDSNNNGRIKVNTTNPEIK